MKNDQVRPSEGAFSDVRAGCCDTWPKPCTYHEGFIDGHMARDDEIERLRAERDAAFNEGHKAGALEQQQADSRITPEAERMQ